MIHTILPTWFFPERKMPAISCGGNVALGRCPKIPMNTVEHETSIYKWLFQLDDSKSLHKKWLEITKHPFEKTGCLEFQVLFIFQL